MAYHAWGGFASPLLIALLVTARKSGACRRDFHRWRPKEDAADCAADPGELCEAGAGGSLQRADVRGDAQVVRKHLKELKKIPGARDVYVALARAGLRYLPARNRKELEKLLAVSLSRRASSRHLV